jgi:gamma-tubulin complex component 2
MLHFLQNFVYYVTLEVIGPRGHELEEWLDKAEDLDEVMELHEKFLDTCLKECLLASQDLLKILTKIMTTCLMFADHMQRFSPDRISSAVADSHHHAADGAGKANKGGKVRTSLRNSAELTNALHQRQTRLRESAEFVQKESSQESFVRILDKFSDTFDTQVA